MVVRSHYRIISVLLALLVIGILSILGYFLICMLLLDPEALQGEPVYVTVGLWIWLVLVFLVLRIVLKDIRHIRIDQGKIVFIHPLLPFLRKSYRWKSLDYFLVVSEMSVRGGSRDAIWLIKNRRLKARIPGFYFANYYDLQNAIGVPSQGEAYINPFKQLLCAWGICKVPTYHRRLYKNNRNGLRSGFL
ncbi:MAG: hypothetical protein LIP04_04690 [Tannerellaceae bacterium]|nr:hypothetical protein [Tannerellaceae bacterium]